MAKLQVMVEARPISSWPECTEMKPSCTYDHSPLERPDQKTIHEMLGKRSKRALDQGDWHFRGQETHGQEDHIYCRKQELKMYGQFNHRKF